MEGGKEPTDVALYIFFFPQMIAGPILRWSAIAPQLAKRVITLAGFAEGIRRFVGGLAKKMIIANVVAVPAQDIFALSANELTTPVAWFGVLCYTLQIYFDFSGYSDMAVGLGKMFGFEFLENFNFPYISQSIKDFWRRWHISLSTWFRDYLYIPLGGNRCSALRNYFNLIIVFFLCGLWHGATWPFVIWGFYHGLFLLLEKTRVRHPCGQNAASVAAHLRHAGSHVWLGVVPVRHSFPGDDFFQRHARLGLCVRCRTTVNPLCDEAGTVVDWHRHPLVDSAVALDKRSLRKNG